MSKSAGYKQGTVVSKSGNKSVKVKILSSKPHHFYKKIIKISSTFMVHDENNVAEVGDQVVFKFCRPLSSTKKWRLIQVIGDLK